MTSFQSALAELSEWSDAAKAQIASAFQIAQEQAGKLQAEVSDRTQQAKENAARAYTAAANEASRIAEQSMRGISEVVGNGLDHTLGESGLNSVQGCPYAKGGCGVNSAKCKAAQQDPEIRHILSRVKTMRTVAIALGMHDSVAALDRYLSGEGGYEEIPEEHVKFVRRTHEETHNARHKQKIAENEAVKKELAARLSAPGGARINPPNPVEFTVVTEDGSKKLESLTVHGLDNAATYYGSTIRTESQYRCTYDGLTYRCNQISSKSYAVDNYDWEGNKSFINISPTTDALLWAYVRPTQVEMNRLQEVGCARPFQRSSRSWEGPRINDVTQGNFANDREIIELGSKRRMKNSRERADNYDITGALPNPGPAEDHLGIPILSAPKQSTPPPQPEPPRPDPEDPPPPGYIGPA